MFPEIFSIGRFVIYSYPLLMGAAWGIAYVISQSMFRETKELDSFRVVFWGMFISAWIGAKVFFLLFSAYDQGLAVQSNFWLGGGFVFYGGFIFAAIFLILYSAIFKKFDLSQAHRFLPGLAFGHGIGRIGCLLAGCCYGTPTNCIVSIHLHNANRHPVQLYESILAISLGFILLWRVKRGAGFLNTVSIYLGGYSLVRFMLEFIRGDGIRGVSSIGLSTSQIISVVLFIVAIFVFYFSWRKRGRNEDLY